MRDRERKGGWEVGENGWERGKKKRRRGYRDKRERQREGGERGRRDTKKKKGEKRVVETEEGGECNACCNNESRDNTHTFKRTSHVSLPNVVTLDSKWLTGGWGVGDFPPGVGPQVMCDYGDRRAGGEVSLSKYVCHVLVLLRVEILYARRYDHDHLLFMENMAVII